MFWLFSSQEVFAFELPAGTGGGYLPVGINLPDGVTATSGAYDSNLNISKKLETRFGDFLQVFGTHYGRSILLSLHAMNPVGQDNLGQYPGFVVGINVIAGFSNTKPIVAIAKKANLGISSKIIPYPMLAFNFGLGVTRKFDIRLTFWPPVPFQKKVGALNAVLKMGSIQLKFGYHALEGGRLKPGITISGVLGYSYTKISLYSKSIENEFQGVNNKASLPVTAGGVAAGNVAIAYTIDALLENNVNYFTGSAEIKFWYDLVFIVPYFGYAVDFTSGSFVGEAAIDTHTTVKHTVGGTTTDYESDTRFNSKKIVRPKAVGHRISLGLQIKIYVFHLITEMQFDLNHKILSAGISTSFKF